MDRYQKVEKPKVESSPINENEIRITSQGAIRNYITYATSLLQEKHGKEIVLKAMGQAISKTVAISEIIKKRVPRLHQDTSISSVSITDVWEPIEEGLVPVEMTRHVSMISITLSTRELDKNSPGYQAPQVEQSKPQNNSYQQQPPVRQVRAPYNAMTEDSSRGRGRGRGSGRGRGQNWSRGGYGNYQEDGYSNHGRGGYRNYQDDGGYSNHGRGGYRNYQDDGAYSNHGRGGYRNYQDDSGYSNHGRGGYRNYQDDGGYLNYGRGGYRNYQDYGGYSNWGRGGGRGRGWGGRGAGYERGRGGGGGGRGGYGGGRGRNLGRGRMGGDSMGRGY